MRRILGVVLAVVSNVGVAVAEPEYVQICFDKAYNEEIDIPFVQTRKRFHYTDLGCTSYGCVFSRASVGSRRLHFFFGRDLPNRVTPGVLGGWAEKAVATARSSNSGRIKLSRRLRNIVRNAVDLARGVELQSLIEAPWLIWGDLDFYAKFSWEARCAERHGAALDAFYERVTIPKGDWAKRRYEEGWFEAKL